MRFATHLELLTHHLQEAGLNLAGRERLAAALERAGWSLAIAAAAVGAARDHGDVATTPEGRR